MTFEGFLN